MKFKFFEVGGYIRDYFLGYKSKDIDYTACPIAEDLGQLNPEKTLKSLEEYLIDLGYSIKLVKKETFTIKASFPMGHKHIGVADFVLARKEIGYIKGTRTPEVVIGTLADDLQRRDFTINAIARNEQGVIIDLFKGEKDLIDKILRTPIDPVRSFNDDPLRILRGIRFCVTKRLSLSREVIETIKTFDHQVMKEKVSGDRVRQELTKMFQYDTPKTLFWMTWLLTINPELYQEVMRHFWLLPTNKKV